MKISEMRRGEKRSMNYLIPLIHLSSPITALLNLICIRNMQTLIFQRIRDHFGRPIIITSGYRPAAYNKSVNGATSSLHV